RITHQRCDNPAASGRRRPGSPGSRCGARRAGAGAIQSSDPLGSGTVARVTVTRSIVLFLLAALAEIGGARLVWQGWREHRGLWWIAAGGLGLGLYGFVATFQPDPHFGRILAAYGGVFVAGSLAWGMVVDQFRPDRWDVIGAAICLRGV